MKEESRLESPVFHGGQCKVRKILFHYHLSLIKAHKFKIK